MHRMQGTFGSQMSPLLVNIFPHLTAGGLSRDRNALENLWSALQGQQMQGSEKALFCYLCSLPSWRDTAASGKDRPIIYGQSGAGCVLYVHIVVTSW